MKPESSLPNSTSDLSDRYSTRRVLLSEHMYGPGYQSSGGSELARELLPQCNLKKGERLLDLGCGNGGTSLIAAHEFGYRVTGVDLSPDNIELCRKSAASLGLKNCDFIQADARNVKLVSPFDAFWCCDALMYVHDKTELLHRIRDLLKESSQNVIVDYGRGSGQLSNEFENYIQFASYNLPTISEYEEIIHNAGFSHVTAVNYTQRFIKMMQDEVIKFEALKAEFLGAYSQQDYDQMIQRWDRKIRFCEQDGLQAFYFIIRT